MDQKPPTAVIEAAHRASSRRPAVRRHRAISTTPTGDSSPRWSRASSRRPTVGWCGTTTSTRSLTGDAPTSVHPSLWRQSQLCAKQGLYEVVEGIYQVRGLDLSNISFIEGDTGIIVIDPLISTETAAAALALYRAHRGDRPVVAVIYTHSHVDHFGGVLGVTTQADVDAGKVAVHRAGALHRTRRAGERLRRHRDGAPGRPTCTARCWTRGPQGQVGCGLGQVGVTGEVALIVPTVDIRETGETHTIDGVEIEFQMAPGTEAPAEMHFYFPQFRALCMAENATHNLHNLLTLRGALVRDPHGWAGYLTEAIDTLRRPHRRRVRLAPLADLGQGPDRRIPFAATGSVRLPARPDAAPAQPGLHRDRDRRELPDAARAGEGVAHPRLLRLGQPQRQGRVPALHGLVRRQPRPAVAAPAGGHRAALRRGDGWHRPRRRDRAQGLRRRRLPLGGNTARPRDLHRREPRRRPASSTPTPSNSSPTAPRTPSGATSSSPARPSCGRATSAPRPRRRRRRCWVS